MSLFSRDEWEADNAGNPTYDEDWVSEYERKIIAEKYREWLTRIKSCDSLKRQEKKWNEKK